MIQAESTTRKERLDSGSEPPGRSTHSAWSDSFTQVWTNALEAADAQLSVCALKTTRTLVMLAGALLALVALFTVAAYGFFLLDASLSDALARPSMPTWFSPLLRGLAYLFIPAAGLAYLWHTVVGFDLKPKKELTEKRTFKA